VVGPHVCSGYIYSPNVGWITMGNGAPADGVQYQNTSATDFGVNVGPDGQLRGLAYGANIGWLRLEEQGAPRVDLNSGQLSGWAYGANVGWVNLGQDGVDLAVILTGTGTDTDSDGLSDDWELRYIDDLASLTESGDFDGDGLSDREEFQLGTNPTEPNVLPLVVPSSLALDQSGLTISWISKPAQQYVIELRMSLGPDGLWTPSALGTQIAEGTLTTRTVPVQGESGFFRIRVLDAASP
jgi:hypothetical protein